MHWIKPILSDDLQFKSQITDSEYPNYPFCTLHPNKSISVPLPPTYWRRTFVSSERLWPENGRNRKSKTHRVTDCHSSCSLTTFSNEINWPNLLWLLTADWIMIVSLHCISTKINLSLITLYIALIDDRCLYIVRDHMNPNRISTHCHLVIFCVYPSLRTRCGTFCWSQWLYQTVYCTHCLTLSESLKRCALYFVFNPFMRCPFGWQQMHSRRVTSKSLHHPLIFMIVARRALPLRIGAMTEDLNWFLFTVRRIMKQYGQSALLITPRIFRVILDYTIQMVMGLIPGGATSHRMTMRILTKINFKPPYGVFNIINRCYFGVLRWILRMENGIGMIARGLTAFILCVT